MIDWYPFSFTVTNSEDKMARIFSIISLNRRYLSASLIYLGMTFMLMCAAPEVARYVQADEETGCTHTVTHVVEGQTVTETVPGCAEGYSCCESTGECVEVE
jgi:hypothetical protein